MTQTIVAELAAAYRNTLGMLVETIANYADPAWRTGPTHFQVPAKVAYHIADCLDYYFKPRGAEYTWGHRFGWPWWEMSDEEQPSPQALIGYLDEVKERVSAHFAQAQDETLGETYDPEVGYARTNIGRYIYALRHTVHHLGSLASLAASQGVQPGSWA